MPLPPIPRGCVRRNGLVYKGDVQGFVRLIPESIMEGSLVDDGDNPEAFILIAKRKWTTAEVNDLPDSAFLFVASGGEKDESGRTVPRTLRMFPVRDAAGALDVPHIRNALARIPQSVLPARVRADLARTARRLLDEATQRE